MSRSIKFRVWRDTFTWPHLGTHQPARWLADRYIGALGSCDLGSDGWGNDAVFFDRTTEEMGGKIYIEQFTGLKDKNGREAYEGDIVRCSLAGTGENLNDSRSMMIGRLNYRADTAGFSISPYATDTIHRVDISALFGRGNVSERLEVIGNVHEHSNLLTTCVSAF